MSSAIRNPVYLRQITPKDKTSNVLTLHTFDKKEILEIYKNEKDNIKVKYTEPERGNVGIKFKDRELRGNLVLTFFRALLPPVADWAEKKALWVWKNDTCVGLFLVCQNRFFTDQMEYHNGLINISFKSMKMWKIRTMKIGSNHTAESFYGKKFTNSDNRVTWLAKILHLRKGFDEAPQLVEVACKLNPWYKSRMNLTGPRAFSLSDIESGNMSSEEVIYNGQFDKPGVANVNYTWECKNAEQGRQNLMRFVNDGHKINVFTSFPYGVKIVYNVVVGKVKNG